MSEQVKEPQLNPRDYPSIKCDKCGSIIFQQATIIKQVPGKVVGQKEQYVYAPVNLFMCAKCGAIFRKDVENLGLHKDLGIDLEESEISIDTKESKSPKLELKNE